MSVNLAGFPSLLPSVFLPWTLIEVTSKTNLESFFPLSYSIFACVTFAAASFLFGYDDKVISPIIALKPFVSLSGVKTTGYTRTWETGADLVCHSLS